MITEPVIGDDTLATLFSGGEGFGLGAQAAGYRHLWGKEFDPRIAGVAQTNGFHTLVADVRIDDYATLPRPYHLHASPVCKNASIAKHDGEESPVDIETAQAVCRAIIGLRPTVFTLENVRGYLRFEAFALIVATLRAEGYGVVYDVLNSANFGVPQTRERLILRAVRGQDRPLLPTPTHARAELITPMFDERLPWVGWLAAIADLLAALPDSEFAAWQQKRLPKEILEWHKAFLVSNATNNTGVGMRDETEPAPTTTTQQNGCLKAFLAPNSTESDIRDDTDLAHTITGSDYKNMRRSALVGSDSKMGMRDGDDPAMTMISSSSRSNEMCAYLMHPTEMRSWQAGRDQDDPAYTIMAGSSAQGRPPHWSPKAVVTAGRVVRLTPRALARFQSFPDWYQLPIRRKPRRLNPREQAWLDRSVFTEADQRWVDEWISCDDALACMVIGNAVPPLLAQRICEVR